MKIGFPKSLSLYVGSHHAADSIIASMSMNSRQALLSLSAKSYSDTWLKYIPHISACDEYIGQKQVLVGLMMEQM